MTKRMKIFLWLKLKEVVCYTLGIAGSLFILYIIGSSFVTYMNRTEPWWWDIYFGGVLLGGGICIVTIIKGWIKTNWEKAGILSRESKKGS